MQLGPLWRAAERKGPDVIETRRWIRPVSEAPEDDHLIAERVVHRGGSRPRAGRWSRDIEPRPLWRWIERQDPDHTTRHG